MKVNVLVCHVPSPLHLLPCLVLHTHAGDNATHAAAGKLGHVISHRSGTIAWQDDERGGVRESWERRGG